MNVSIRKFGASAAPIEQTDVQQPLLASTKQQVGSFPEAPQSHSLSSPAIDAERAHTLEENEELQALPVREEEGCGGQVRGREELGHAPSLSSQFRPSKRSRLSEEQQSVQRDHSGQNSSEPSASLAALHRLAVSATTPPTPQPLVTAGRSLSVPSVRHPSEQLLQSPSFSHLQVALRCVCAAVSRLDDVARENLERDRQAVEEMEQRVSGLLASAPQPLQTAVESVRAVGEELAKRLTTKLNEHAALRQLTESEAIGRGLLLKRQMLETQLDLLLHWSTTHTDSPAAAASASSSSSCPSASTTSLTSCASSSSASAFHKAPPTRQFPSPTSQPASCKVPAPATLPTTTAPSGSESVKKKRQKISKEVVESLRSWMFAHFDHPYPDDDTKQRLANTTGLTLDQINNWFINARGRIWKPMMATQK